MPTRPLTKSSKSGREPIPQGKPTPKASVGTKKVPRSRTFTGCRTCRNRHLKCDEARPVCSSCKRLGLVCEGYGGQLLWVPDILCSAVHKDSHRGTSYRYPIFTEDERNSMSFHIVESMKGRSAGDIVSDLDERSVHDDDAHLVGPFGVFRACEESTRSASSPTLLHIAESLPKTSQNRHLSQPMGDSIDKDEEEVVIEPWAVEDNSLSIEPCFPHGSFDSFNTDGMINNTSQAWTHGEASGVFTRMMDMDCSTPNPLFPSRSPRTPAMDHAELESTEHENTEEDLTQGHTSTSFSMQDLPIHLKLPTPSAGIMPGAETSLPIHAAPLLRYYKSMEASLSVKGVRTSPWKLFLLPCALETFAELSLWNTTSHARHTILCTLLAKSAFHLHHSLNRGGVKRTSQWFDVGKHYQRSAQSHLKQALQSESNGPSQASYNEILMAILATAMVSVMYNGSRAVKIFLLDAERLIRVRGLAMPKTFHMRVLHHVYTHLRVIAESTDIAVDSAKGQVQTAADMAVSLRKFRVAEDCLGADLDLSREKPAEIGYSDIHLDTSGHWPLTMYPDIYGIPESLMTLLSQTISLANEKGKLEAIAMSDPRVSMALARHIKQLEQNIWSWSFNSADMESGPSRPWELVTKHTRLVDHPIVKSLTLAMHQALIIYFYRRVYNMSAMVIKDAVQKTLDLIQPCMKEAASDHEFAASIGWAGFVAACEATTPDLQERGRKILEAIDNKGVIFGTDKPSKLAQGIWDKRKETGDWTISWLDMMQNT
ncbi:hypothetical protein LX32DRAFT_705667 [Colletotrichum zoysiae]|uniref:Zn(2)-C6 fungal-type domain-containing protein n=1 Tax=Colletotrichum zoysiae TaxID=1216348 RepID=A0AAD9HQJ2_9PEZI|nr:hypothetical protein LX32DRAFT_705667 [Colletotrichum zoysiae]